MSDEKHSPGPWRWTSRRRGQPQSVGLVGADGRMVICGAVDTEYDDDLPTSVAVTEADARLIAAAPEMLALLRNDAEPGDCPCHHCRGLSTEYDAEMKHRLGCRLDALLARIDKR